MPPTHLAPSVPLLKGRNLAFGEREEIALECARGTGVRAIARKLGRSSSTRCISNPEAGGSRKES